MAEGTHKHRCRSCGLVWEHPDMTLFCNKKEFEERHTCQRCGTTGNKEHYRPEMPSLDVCELTMIEGVILVSVRIEMAKDYLVYENERNHKNHVLYERVLRKAFGKDANILVAHHLTFEVAGGEPVEIPSADTLMFDHILMRKVFGEDYSEVMASLALTPVETRDQVLLNYMELLDHHGSAFPQNLTISDT